MTIIWKPNPNDPMQVELKKLVDEGYLTIVGYDQNKGPLFQCTEAAKKAADELRKAPPHE